MHPLSYSYTVIWLSELRMVTTYWDEPGCYWYKCIWGNKSLLSERRIGSGLSWRFKYPKRKEKIILNLIQQTASLDLDMLLDIAILIWILPFTTCSKSITMSQAHIHSPDVMSFFITYFHLFWKSNYCSEDDFRDAQTEYYMFAIWYQQKGAISVFSKNEKHTTKKCKDISDTKWARNIKINLLKVSWKNGTILQNCRNSIT